MGGLGSRIPCSGSPRGGPFSGLQVVPRSGGGWSTCENGTGICICKQIVVQLDFQGEMNSKQIPDTICVCVSLSEGLIIALKPESGMTHMSLSRNLLNHNTCQGCPSNANRDTPPWQPRGKNKQLAIFELKYLIHAFENT